MRFQFTRPRGARREPIGNGGDDHAVSIHAPTGGATTGASRSRTSAQCFNSRAHGGRDSSPETPNAKINGFNSRAHGGRDHDVNANRAR